MEFDIIIKTFERYPSLKKLLQSIEVYYPEAHIIISDDSPGFNEKFYKQFNLNLEVLYLGVDVGLSCGRNEAVKRSKRKYILLLDDDFVLTKDTKIDLFLKIIKHTGAMVAGGSLDTNGNIDGYNQLLDIKGAMLTYQDLPAEYENVDGTQYQYADIVYNFALFDTAVFETVRWDEVIKIKGEHTDFFLQLKQAGHKAVYVPEVVIKHKPVRTRFYKKMRSRNDGFYYFFHKWNINKIVTGKGHVSELGPGGTIKFYREK